MWLVGHPIIASAGPRLTGYTSSSSSSSTSSPTTLPPAAAGDLLIMLVTQTNGTSGMSLSTPSGWQVGATSTGTNSLRRFTILWKWATGSESSSLTLSGTSGAYNVITMAFRGVKNDPVFGSAKVQNSSNSMTPNGCTVAWAGEKLWMSLTANENAITAGIGYPSGWDDIITTVGASGTNPARNSVAFKRSSLLTETPGGYTAPSLVPNWISFTVALQ